MFAYTQDVPIDAGIYGRIMEGLGAQTPDGLVVHLAVDRPEGGLRYIDVWETEAQWQRFVEERLHPVVHGMLSAVFGDNLPPEPEATPLPVVHAWTGAANLPGQ